MVYTINIFAAFCRVYHYGKIKSLCGFFFFFFFFKKGDGLVTEREGKVGGWERGQGWREKGGEERDKSRKTERAPAQYHQVTDDGVWPGEKWRGSMLPLVWTRPALFGF